MSAVKKTTVDLAKIINNLKLSGETQSKLLQFKKRSDDAKILHMKVQEKANSKIDFNAYRSLLAGSSNRKIVDELESYLNNFKPKEDLASLKENLDNLEKFKAEALESAKLTEKAVGEKLLLLRNTIANIETAIPIEEIQTHNVYKADPDFELWVMRLIENGSIGRIPGYEQKFKNLDPLS
ncbi:hypothetical protein ACO0SA_001912 [Hanseniaspora valbyensis]